MTPTTEAGRRLLKEILPGKEPFQTEVVPTRAVIAIEAEARAALLAELTAGVAHQHRRVETVTQDGDDWIGCLCGEPDDNCAVLDLIRKAGE